MVVIEWIPCPYFWARGLRQALISSTCKLFSNLYIQPGLLTSSHIFISTFDIIMDGRKALQTQLSP